MSVSKTRAWLIASRLKTLPAAIVPVWSGCLMAYHLEAVFDLTLAVLTVLGAIFIQIATNFFNDVIDARKGADTEKRIGPTRATVSGLLRPREVYLGAALMLVLASLCGLILFQARGWPIIAIGIPSLYLSFGYTGGVFPLAYRGVGELFVILFFGLIAVMGTIFVQTGAWPVEGAILGLQIGFLSAVLIAVNNYRDVEEDREVDKLTLAVRLGRPISRVMILVMTMAPALLVIAIGGGGTWFSLALGLAIIFISLEIRMLRDDGVSSRLLGLSALHLILFVIAQNVGMALTW